MMKPMDDRLIQAHSIIDTPSLSLLKIDPPNSKRCKKIPAVDWHAKCMAERPDASIIEFGLAPCSKIDLTFCVFF